MIIVPHPHPHVHTHTHTHTHTHAHTPYHIPHRYDTTDGSEDSGLVVTEGETFSGTTDPPLHGFKYLHL